MKRILTGIVFLISFSIQAKAQEVQFANNACSKTQSYLEHSIWVLPLVADYGDTILVDKSHRLLHVLQNEKVIRTYRVALGKNSTGKKHQEGDGKTPEGIYSVGYKNSASKFHLSLAVSYPEQEDIDWARKNGVDPGGDIMIHGLPNNPIERLLIGHPRDWTKGCIAVTDAEIEEIWNLIATDSTIIICP